MRDQLAASEAVWASAGWWLLAATTAVFALFIVHRGGWRRFWLGLEDPRTMGLVRIVFAFFAICNINGLWEHFTYLWSDEGMFPAAVARQLLAAGQFSGFGDGVVADEPWGFFDGAAVLRYAHGPRFSLLHFWDSPTAMWIHIAAFWVAAGAFMVGLRTRLAGVLAFGLMNSLLHRNGLFWEGTDIVFRVFMAYLVLSRCGRAYSVDNWLRCRRLAKAGRLSERDGAGAGAGVAPCPEHPQGLEAIYRRIPVWPRRLMMLQLAALYFTTGALKSGGVWAQGDAIYYALNLDHFYRVPLQPLTALLGTTVLPVVTWFVRFGEIAFGLVFVGMVLRLGAEEQLVRPSRWATGLSWLAVGGACLGLVLTAWPDTSRVPSTAGWWGMGVAVLVLVVVWRIAGLGWIRRYLLGRRIWLTWAVCTMGGIYLVMNIGQFQTVMLTLCLVYLRGDEVARGLAWVRRGPSPVPAEDETLPHLHHDGLVLPGWVLWGALAAGVVGIVAHVRGGPGGWIALTIAAFLIGVTWARARGLAGRRPSTARAWAYGPAGRLVIGAGLIWHITAVGIWLMPAYDSLKSVRASARAFVRTWLVTTQTDQGWGMFAPNPPRANDFLQVLVTDQDGEVWDMLTDLHAPERRTFPFIWNDRARKMNRVLIRNKGTGKRYRPWVARYHCRQWAMDHDGEVPRSVQLVHHRYSIPSPQQTHEKGWYDPEDLFERTGKAKVLHTETCATAVLGQPTPVMRARHGLPPDEFRPWVRRKRARWEGRNRRRK
ncbi:MAG: hypothetical protein K0V04_38330 [Deltaproteobacteria bacterium]|nr:hypothetical protein [Deltaproteobacteria bacterium]